MKQNEQESNGKLDNHLPLVYPYKKIFVEYWQKYMNSYSIGIDTGGTCTDGVLMHNSLRAEVKIP